MKNIELKQLIINIIDYEIEKYFSFVQIYIDKQFDIYKIQISKRI